MPINSSHYCWGTEPLPDRVFEKLLSAVDRDELEKATEEIRRYDIPRVSNAQMAAIGQLLGEPGPWSSLPMAEGLVRVAVLHHQLLPVGASEEFKAFESLTNLGAVREFLASLATKVVLHGHKHTGALYWDFVADQQRLSSPPARVLVVAGPGVFRPGYLVARVLDVSARDGAPEVRIEDLFAAERRGGPIRRTLTERARLWDDPATAVTTQTHVIRGETPSEVYARVQSRFDAVLPGGVLRYLICEIGDPEDAQMVPVGYPELGNPEEVEAWMKDLVEWWQLPEPKLSHGVVFNHGERIYKRWGDQVDRAAKLLSAAVPGDPYTTRAAILLLDPSTESSPQSAEFPSFVSVQLQLISVGASWRLDCTGSFRKQEMRYWWPINVAELAKIQKAVASKVIIDGHNPHVGELRTIAALAIAEKRLPDVAVPAVDRAVDQRQGDLWLMAYSLIDPEKAGDPASLRAMWDRYLRELRPAGLSDDAPTMSHRGLKTVLDFVQAVEPASSSAAAAALEAIVEFYGFFGEPTGAHPENAREGAIRRLDALENELDALFGARPSSGGGS